MTDPRDPRTPPQGLHANARIEALCHHQAEQFDPVGLAFIQGLARRAADREGAARALLERRLADALREYEARLDLATAAAGAALEEATTRFPDAAASLRQRQEAGDPRGIGWLLARRQARGSGSALAALLAKVSQSGSGPPRPDTTPGELKSMRHFRGLWSRLGAQRQLARAFADAPKNAGPLNSHFLVLQALRQMGDVSPEYLERFMAYADGLLWLDQAESCRAPAQKPRAGTTRNRKRKTGAG